MSFVAATSGALLFKGVYPSRDAFVLEAAPLPAVRSLSDAEAGLVWRWTALFFHHPPLHPSSGVIGHLGCSNNLRSVAILFRGQSLAGPASEPCFSRCSGPIGIEPQLNNFADFRLHRQGNPGSGPWRDSMTTSQGQSGRGHPPLQSLLAGAEFMIVHSALQPLASPPWRCSSRNRAAKVSLCFVTGLGVGACWLMAALLVSRSLLRGAGLIADLGRGR